MEALKEGSRQHSCLWVKDGEQAMQALSREGEFADAARPDLILLDLNLPKKHGHDVLAAIKSDPLFKSIPVFVLTTSVNEDDIEKTYMQFADAYIAKPLELREFETAVHELRSPHGGALFSHV